MASSQGAADHWVPTNHVLDSAALKNDNFNQN